MNVHGGGMQRRYDRGRARNCGAQGLALHSDCHPHGRNNAAYAKTVFANHGVNYVTADSMEDAAARVVALVRKEAA